MEEPTQEQLSNPSWISEQIIHLAAELEHESELLALAELEEDKEAVSLIDRSYNQASIDDVAVMGGKKLSVAESEKRALVNTNNKYHELKYKREAKVEMINALKKRLDVLSWEYNTAGNRGG